MRTCLISGASAFYLGVVADRRIRIEHRPPMHGVIPLHLLAPGASALVSAVYGDVEQVHRLHELGIREGAQVRMVQPGKPCIVHLEGSRLCIRGDDSLGVLVAPSEVAA